MKRDIVIAFVILGAFWLGCNVTHGIMKRSEQRAVEHAIATFEPSPLNCDDQAAIGAIKSLAENGAHISRFDIDVYWEYREGQ